MHPTAHIVLQPDCIRDHQVGTALQYLAREGFHARAFRVVQLRREDLELIYPQIFQTDTTMATALVRLHHAKPSIILEVMAKTRNSPDALFAKLEKIKNGDPLDPKRVSLRRATRARSKIENRIHIPGVPAENVALKRVAESPRHGGLKHINRSMPKNIRARSVWSKWLASAKNPVRHFIQPLERHHV